MRDAPTPDDAELRLALGMRGGVSLAVWIGGACAEIDALRRAADEKQGFWWEVLSASPYSRVVVDVMAGASAGGLNGVLFATAIRHGFRMEELAPVWRQVAAIDDLRRRSAPWISLLDGDLKFLDVIRDTLDRYVRPRGTDGEAAGEAAPERVGSIDVQLSATLVEPVVRSATSPRDETLRKHRSGARFHFRHDPAAALPRRDLDAECIPQLAVAARATASFPAAFEPAVVRSRRPETFDSVPAVPARPDRGDGVGERLADCHGFFSESRGRRTNEPALFEEDDFVVADGGIVDNIPLGRPSTRSGTRRRTARPGACSCTCTRPVRRASTRRPPPQARRWTTRPGVAACSPWAAGSSWRSSRASRSTVTWSGSSSTTAASAWASCCAGRCSRS